MEKRYRLSRDGTDVGLLVHDAEDGTWRYAVVDEDLIGILNSVGNRGFAWQVAPTQRHYIPETVGMQQLTKVGSADPRFIAALEHELGWKAPCELKEVV